MAPIRRWITTSGESYNEMAVVRSCGSQTTPSPTRAQMDRTKLETDRVAYRRAYQRANHLINSSRQNYFRDQLSNATGARSRWSIAKRLLLSNCTVKSRTFDELQRLCTTFSTYFVTKITTFKPAVAETSHNLTIPPHPDSAYTGSLFDTQHCHSS